ncbi:MAG: amidase [Bacteroidales bacterium]|nr:amidase [Bacteroidales bacterium]
MKTTTYLLSILFLVLVFFSCKDEPREIDAKTVQLAQKIVDLEFSETEIDSMLEALNNYCESYQAIREVQVSNEVAPRLYFDPRPRGFRINSLQEPIDWQIPSRVQWSGNIEELAFYPVSHLASLIQSRQISSVELTRMYLRRLKTYGDTLQCVVSLTEEMALEQAAKADQEIAVGHYRGPLHGIPYGIKDLFAVEGYKTTWGAAPYKNQQIDETATVVRKLEDAGAVLVAKLSLGALAMGDVWFGGVTKNPWDLTQGSSGSSAGSASATAAGLVGFAIGTETWGSIVSPSTRCGVTGLRPTFGRVSRNGAMALSWSMDKVGPICRNAFDCALVFDAIRGDDEKDPSTVDYPFNYQEKPITEYKVGYIKSFFNDDYRGHANDSVTLEVLKQSGVSLHEVELPANIPVSALAIILESEAAAAFDGLTRSNRDDELTAQHRYAWPNIFRAARFIPAAEYIQASRLRNQLIEELNRILQNYDIIVTPSYGGNQLLMTNLTGHPCIVVPNGFDDEQHPTSISFLGNLYDEASLLSFAKHYQESTGFHQQIPDFFRSGQ